MEFLKNLGTNVWGLISLFAGLAVFVEFGIPLGHWFWAWAGQNAMVLIALAVVGCGAGLLQGRTHEG